MKIAFALRHYHKKGGISRSSSSLAEGMVRAGHDVHIFASSAENLMEGITFHQVPMSTAFPFWERLSFARNATRMIERENFDIVNNQGGGSLYTQDVVTARSCHRAWVEIKKKNDEYLRYLFNPLHHAILHIEKVAYQPSNFRHVISVSVGVARELTKYHGVPSNKISSIPNGVDLQRFSPDKREPSRKFLEEQYGLTPESVILLFTGREFRRKGLGLIIEALAILQNPYLKLLVCGSDSAKPYRRQAERLGVAEQVVFAGRIDKVETYYAGSDIFVFPTLYEAFSLSTLEAAASGLAQVVTNINGTEELIEDGQNGFFCQRDAFSIAEKIKIIAENPQTRKEMGTNARKTALNFSWDLAVERTLALYENIIKAKQDEK